MLQAANELLDLPGADIRRRELERTRLTARAVRSAEPRSSFLEAPLE
jgi:hypothetical protein